MLLLATIHLVSLLLKIICICKIFTLALPQSDACHQRPVLIVSMRLLCQIFMNSAFDASTDISLDDPSWLAEQTGKPTKDWFIE